MRGTRPNNYRQTLGKAGEDYVQLWLEKKAYKILERNFRKAWGEVDIIARDGDTLCFIEVKHWKTGYLRDLGRVLDAPKKKRMQRLAAFWLEQNPVKYSLIRFDLALLNQDTRELEYLEGALN